MNDLILSGLLNLFALFGALNRTDKDNSKKIVANYLRRHFGVSSLESYVGLYSDLRDYYDDYPSLDKDDIIQNVCSRIQHKISHEDQALMLLRFMEFCGNDSLTDDNIYLYKKVAGISNVPDSMFEDFKKYIKGDSSEGMVKIIREEGINGFVKTLYIKEFNKLVFTYTGTDEVFMDDIPVLQGSFLVWQRSGVLKSRHAVPLYFSNIMAMYEDRRIEDKIELAGRKMDFRFKKSKNGIHDMSFTLHGGELVAIMGGSGVGKSTLLSLLNGNLKPNSGSITLNGYDISAPEVKDLIGFVPQDDLLIEELTVYQNLYYTARLCFDKISEEEIDRRVVNVLTDLGLDAARDLKVGSAINKYISGGQRKRLNIALELIREPSVLYLDEPTSGLSSADSEKVMNLLKEQTYKGRLIVVNIHQPSSDIFKLFDHLWLLDKGGYPIYDGNPIEAITYFKRVAEYADADVSACAECGNVNPEIILNIIEEKSLNDSGQMTDERKVSPEEWHSKYLDSNKETAHPDTLDIPETKQKKPSLISQFLIFLRRNFSTKITNTQYLLISLLEAPLLAVIVSVLTRYSPPGGYTVMDNKNIVSYFFMAVIVAIFIGMSGSAEEIFRDRALLRRERFLRLSYHSYIWSKITFMACLSLIQTFLFVVIGNLIMGIHCLFGVWWLILFVSAFLANLTGLLLSQSLNSIVSIYITIPLLLIPQILLCGLVVDFDDLAPNSKTGNVPLIGEIIPSRWAFEALSVTSFTSNKYEKDRFEDDKDKYTYQYYNAIYLYELESQLEISRKEQETRVEGWESHIETIRKCLPELTHASDIDPYSGDYSYDSLNDYFDKVAYKLQQLCFKYNQQADKKIQDYINQNGKEAFIKLKKDNFNTYLSDLVMNSKSEEFCNIIDNRIIPKAGHIYLNPVSKNGRAPFYSSVKIIGNTEIDTLWFNIGIMLLMCIILTLMLLSDFPGKYLRNER